MVTDALEALIRGKYRAGAARSTAPAGALSLSGADVGGGEGAAASQRRRLQVASVGGAENPVDDPVPLEACDWLNITACDTTGEQGRGCMPSCAAAGGQREGETWGMHSTPSRPPSLPPANSSRCLCPCACSAPVLGRQGHPCRRLQLAWLEPGGATACARQHRQDVRMGGHRWGPPVGWGESCSVFAVIQHTQNLLFSFFGAKHAPAIVPPWVLPQAPRARRWPCSWCPRRPPCAACSA